MRWMLVFLFLYLIPLIILFKNYSNFKRSCIYSSIYIILVSTIVITNIYISGLNKIKEAMYYQNYAFDKRYSDKSTSHFEKDYNLSEKEKADNNKGKDISQENVDKENDKNDSNEIVKIDEKEVNQVEISNKQSNYSVISKDKELILNYKKNVYEIETIALTPMRECLPYTKNISKNIKQLSTIKEDIEYALNMCQEVITMYEKMEIPSLSKEEYTKAVYNSRNDVKNAYELRKRAMENALKLIDSKNPKYIGQIMEYLELSDQHIASFKERLKDLNNNIDKQEAMSNEK